MTSKLLAIGGVLGLVILTGCGGPEEQAPLPDEIADFDQLYQANCSGCHGQDGRGQGPQLNDPVYQALIPKEMLQKVIVSGRPGTPMPAFGKSAGGSLTDQQIQILVDGMQKNWGKPGEFAGVSLPPYSTTEAGDVSRGAIVFQSHCSPCHGRDGRGAAVAGSVVDPSYLALATDQLLRTTVITGRRLFGMPDWQHSPGKPLQPQEITDVVAWLISHRTPPALSASVPEQKGATQP